MKVTHITDIDKFFEVIDSCKGRVELVTGEGDRLNLKSKLSQYVSLANIFSAGEIPELEIVAAEKEDIDKLMNFINRQGGAIKVRPDQRLFIERDLSVYKTRLDTIRKYAAKLYELSL